jgi:hypothetical protein
MHLLDGKKGILRPKKGLVFELRPQLAAFYRGPTPIAKAPMAPSVFNSDFPPGRKPLLAGGRMLASELKFLVDVGVGKKWKKVSCLFYKAHQ